MGTFCGRQGPEFQRARIDSPQVRRVRQIEPLDPCGRGSESEAR